MREFLASLTEDCCAAHPVLYFADIPSALEFCLNTIMGGESEKRRRLQRVLCVRTQLNQLRYCRVSDELAGPIHLRDAQGWQ